MISPASFMTGPPEKVLNEPDESTIVDVTPLTNRKIPAPPAGSCAPPKATAPDEFIDGALSVGSTPEPVFAITEIGPPSIDRVANAYVPLDVLAQNAIVSFSFTEGSP